MGTWTYDAKLIEARKLTVETLVAEHRYVAERLATGTFTMEEARTWLVEHGHDKPQK